MDEQLLFFKDKIIRENDLEIIFHKDFVWIYNETPMPVVRYTLTNCKDLPKIDFKDIDIHNDGVIIETRQKANQFVFETTDMGNRKIAITCDKIAKQEQEYRKVDLIDLLKEFQRQINDEYETNKMLNDRFEYLEKLLDRELDISERKKNQADWLTDDRKNFTEGQQDILKKIVAAINRRKQEDFERRQNIQ